MGSKRQLQAVPVLVLLALQLFALSPVLSQNPPARSTNSDPPATDSSSNSVVPDSTSTVVPPTPLLPASGASPSQPTQPSSASSSGGINRNPQQQQQQGGSQSSGSSGTGGPTTSAVPDSTAGKTRNEQEQAAAANQAAPDSDNSQQQPDGAGNSDNAVNLLSIAGCSSAVSNYLPAGLDGSCEVQGVVSRRETDLFSFSLPQATNDTRPYRLLLILRSVDSNAQLGLSIPSPSGTSPVPDTIGTQVYSTEITTQVVIELPWFVIAQNPGRYLISISRARRRLLYTLQVETPFNDVMLAEPDLSAIKDLHTACCVEGGATSSLCTQFLPRALAPNHSPDDDMCRMTPMTCNSDGRLTQLAIAQAGLICPRGLPASMSQLDALVTMDLAFNFVNMSAAGMAKIVAGLPALQNAFLRYTGLSGPLSCDLVANPSLTRLSISGNNVTGSLPACMLQDPTLQELYLSQTGLNGPLPDVVPANSPLRLLYAINFIQPERTGFTGPIPVSLLSSPSLTYLNLANNALSGGLGQLPPQLRVLNVSNNALDGRISGDLPPSIETYDASYNGLQGGLPGGLAAAGNISLLDLSYNRLSGALPAQLPPALAVLDVGTNEFTGSLPAIPATLRYLGASNNSITGPLPALPGASQLRFMYLQSNQLTGGLPPSLIDGRAPLLLLDLHSNKLSGPLDSAAAAAAAVGGASSRRLLQQQGGASGDQQQAGGSGGSAWSFDTLALLDLSRNGFSGPIPASLGGLQGLSYLDLSANALTGSLAAYADAMASNASQASLLHLNVSSNRLTGEVPASLAAAPMLDPERLNGRRSAGVPRVLDLSGNSFQGPFPTALVSQAEAAQAACANMCSVKVLLNGTDMALACPEQLQVLQAQLQFLQQANYVCKDGSGQQVSLLAATNLPESSSSQPAADSMVTGQPFTIPTGGITAAARKAPQQQQKGLAPGAIAGIVIGSVAGAALLAAAAVFGYKKTKRHRAGWRKDELAGGPAAGGLNDAFGITGLPPPSSLTAPPAAAAGAANGTNGAGPGRGVRFADAGGDPAYPHTPYERSQAGIEMLANRHNEV